MKRSVVLFIVAGTTASAAQAQDIAWNNASGGSWNVVNNWLPINIPDTNSERAIIALAGPYVVTVNNTVACGGMDLLGAGAEVQVLNAQALIMRGTVLNNRVIVINPAGGGNGTFLQFEVAGVISGTGRIRLNANPGNLGTGVLRNIGAGSFVQQEAGHTIHGLGQITGNFINNGVV